MFFKKMNVLGLFDGMSCGQIALNRAGVKYDNYFASEIKPHAIKVTQHNYPNTVQLGDVTKIKASDLPKIDLLIGGSPCQDFSQGNKKRLGLNGNKSVLFFEYLRLLNELKPKYFLLENVEMGKNNIRILSEYLDCFPVNINSSRVSAQFRNRYYWTNINGFKRDMFNNYSNIPQPIDKNIKLQDILESGYTDKIKSRSLNTKCGCSEKNQQSFINRYLTTGMVTAVYLSEDLDINKGIRHFTHKELERLQTIPNGYTDILTKNQAWNLIGDGWTIDIIAHIFSFLKLF